MSGLMTVVGTDGRPYQVRKEDLGGPGGSTSPQALADGQGLTPAVVLPGSPAQILAQIRDGVGGTPTLAQPVGADVPLSANTSAQLHAASATRWETTVYNPGDAMVFLNINAAAGATAWVGRVQPQSSTTLTRPQSQGQLNGWCSVAVTLRVVTQAVA